jgi:hypothetical protein
MLRAFKVVHIYARPEEAKSVSQPPLKQTMFITYIIIPTQQEEFVIISQDYNYNSCYAFKKLENYMNQEKMVSLFQNTARYRWQCFRAFKGCANIR